MNENNDKENNNENPKEENITENTDGENNNENLEEENMNENTDEESSYENLKESDLEMSDSSHWGSDSDESNILSDEAICER